MFLLRIGPKAVTLMYILFNMTNILQHLTQYSADSLGRGLLSGHMVCAETHHVDTSESVSVSVRSQVIRTAMCTFQPDFTNTQERVE